ncbi:hypothetical protein HS99_0001830 [Kitasatospora aureofaciens]|uniref:Uncharacterized protein n=1 Tax=Kitasatospora aureofaciens TaxID=1894 RepID=A0A1E7NFL2_KITAU|nr:hypothetical protein HS99_0001830 [Kitasatospora aureofaciens]
MSASSQSRPTRAFRGRHAGRILATSGKRWVPTPWLQQVKRASGVVSRVRAQVSRRSRWRIAAVRVAARSGATGFGASRSIANWAQTSPCSYQSSPAARSMAEMRTTTVAVRPRAGGFGSAARASRWRLSAWKRRWAISMACGPPNALDSGS